MNEVTNAQAKEALKAVFRKASADANFRAKCLSNPKAAVKEAAGMDVPAGLEIKFVEPGSAIVVSLPPHGASEEAIEEEALAGVAGGGQGKGISERSF
jgi:hypothetical protein